MTTFFNTQNGQLYAEQVSLKDIAAQFGTPCYVYSRAALTHLWQQFDQAFAEVPHLTCFSVKANANLTLLNILAKLGSGFDIVSQGELERVLLAKGDPKRVVFSGVGKQPAEMARALEVGISSFHLESMNELHLLQTVAQQKNCLAPISVRVNPDVNPQTHPYIATGLQENKFGVDPQTAVEIYQTAQTMSHIKIKGIACHIGSQLTQLSPFEDALDRLLQLIDELNDRHNIQLECLDFGGGLGIQYTNEQPPSVTAYATALKNKLKSRSLTLILEPGRVIAAHTGILLTEVMLIKTTASKNFAVVDCALNDLIRPALYQAQHRITRANPSANNTKQSYDIVGPICETADCFSKNLELSLQEKDLLAIHAVGAYGSVMASNYNGRNRAAEVLVDDHQVFEIKRREQYPQQWANEIPIPEL